MAEPSGFNDILDILARNIHSPKLKQRYLALCSELKSPQEKEAMLIKLANFYAQSAPIDSLQIARIIYRENRDSIQALRIAQASLKTLGLSDRSSIISEEIYRLEQGIQTQISEETEEATKLVDTDSNLNTDDDATQLVPSSPNLNVDDINEDARDEDSTRLVESSPKLPKEHTKSINNEEEEEEDKTRLVDSSPGLNIEINEINEKLPHDLPPITTESIRTKTADQALPQNEQEVDREEVLNSPKKHDLVEEDKSESMNQPEATIEQTASPDTDDEKEPPGRYASPAAITFKIKEPTEVTPPAKSSPAEPMEVSPDALPPREISLDLDSGVDTPLVTEDKELRNGSVANIEIDRPLQEHFGAVHNFEQQSVLPHDKKPSKFADAILRWMQQEGFSGHEPIVSDLLQGVWGRSLDSDILDIIREKSLMNKNEGLWGLYLDALISSGNPRKALLDIRRTIDANSSTSLASISYKRLLIIWEKLGLQGFAWEQKEGITPLVDALAKNPLPNIEGMGV